MKMTSFNKIDLSTEECITTPARILSLQNMSPVTSDEIFIKYNIPSIIEQADLSEPIVLKSQRKATKTIEIYDVVQRTEYTFDKTKFQIANVFKIIWLRNITKNGGAQLELLKQMKPNEIIIKSVTKKHGQIWALIPKIKLIHLASSNHGIYEIVVDYPRKVYFDIDKITDQEPLNGCNVYLNTITNKLSEYFVNAKYSISGSCDNIETGKWKISFHIIINNYIVKTANEFTLLHEFVKYLKNNFDNAFDTNVYALRSQNFKCINQSKPDGRIQKLITNDDITTHFISCYFAKYSYALPDFNIICDDEQLLEHMHDARVCEKLNLATLPQIKNKLKVPEDFDIMNASPGELLYLLPISPEFSHEYTHKVARFCFHSNLSFDIFYSWYIVKQDSEETLNKWTKHWDRLGTFPEYDKSHIISIIKYYYPKITDLGRFHKFKNNFTNRPDNVNVSIIETLSEAHYKNLYNESTLNNDGVIQVIDEITGPKFNIMNIGMGSGKTAQTVNFLSKVNNFIWIAPNQALTSNTLPRINEVLKDTSKCMHYKDDFKTLEKNKNEMRKADKIIICLNSLHYLSKRKYENVIIDEIDTFLHKWFDNSTITKNAECWNALLYMIREAKVIILLDAFTSNLTINFINKVRKDQDAIQLYEREVELSDISVEHIVSNMKWIYEIKESLIQNKRIFIYYPYKDGNSKRKSMIDFKQFLEEQTGKKGILYNGDSDADTKKTLKNINDTWCNFDFVLTNNTITVGVNYDEIEDSKIFDLVFVSLAGFSMPRDVVQASKRCRTTREKMIKMTFFDSVNTRSDFHNDIYLYENCPIYKQLQDDILIERRAPLKEAVHYFFKKAGCKMINDIIPLHKKIEKELKAIFDTKFDNIIPYDDIPDIQDTDHLESIKTKIYEQEETTMDKLIIKKYYFKQNFDLDNIPDNVLATAWEGRYNLFFERLGLMIEDPQHLVKQIMIFNNIEKFEHIVNDFKKLKLNQELKDRICTENHLKDLTIKSKDTSLIRAAINTYFNKK